MLEDGGTSQTGGINWILVCPGCGGTYLHHGVVNTFDRDEDAENGRHVRIGRGVVIDHDLRNNPSFRRGGLTITFSCETCSAESTLRIAQHKGQTFVTLDVTRQRPEGVGP